MKSVLICIRPEWCVKIASGEKAVEVRKTRPKLEPPFRAYVYCSSVKAMPLHLYVKLHAQTNGLVDVWNGKVFASFICDRMDTLVPATEPYGIYDVDDDYVIQTCLANGVLWDYGNGATLYGWRISALEIYDRPRELSEFRRGCTNVWQCESCALYTERTEGCGNSALYLKRPPQSWCYVEKS